MNKKEFKDKIQAGRDLLDAAVAQISDERMTLIILHGEWSVKDLVGHLCFWEERVATLYSTLKAGKTPVSYDDMDRLNGQAITEMRKLSLQEVRSRELSAYKKILSILDVASDSELFDSNHFSWTSGRTFEQIISDNTYGHYEEHLPEVNAWLKRVA